MNDKDRYDLRRNQKIKLNTLQVAADKLRLQLENGDHYFDLSDSACLRLFIDVTREIERLCKELQPEQPAEAQKPIMLGEIPVAPGSKLWRLAEKLDIEERRKMQHEKSY